MTEPSRASVAAIDEECARCGAEDPWRTQRIPLRSPRAFKSGWLLLAFAVPLALVSIVWVVIGTLGPQFQVPETRPAWEQDEDHPTELWIDENAVAVALLCLFAVLFGWILTRTRSERVCRVCGSPEPGSLDAGPAEGDAPAI